MMGLGYKGVWGSVFNNNVLNRYFQKVRAYIMITFAFWIVNSISERRETSIFMVAMVPKCRKWASKPLVLYPALSAHF